MTLEKRCLANKSAIVTPGAANLVILSQSGERPTHSLEFAKTRGQRVLSVVNVQTSTMARASHVVLPSLVGPEIGVASARAFTCQLATLICVAIGAGRRRGVLSAEGGSSLVRGPSR